MVYKFNSSDSLPTKLYKLRCFAHLTQKELARFLGLNQTVISRSENSYSDTDIVLSYCVFFGVSIYDLLGYPHPTNSIEIINVEYTG